jgi:fibronectin-binding autotransporter adhesin
LADGGEDAVYGLVEGEVVGVDGVGGDAFVVGTAEAEAALGEVEVGEVGAGGGGGVGGLGGAAGGEGIEVCGEVDDGGVGRLFEEQAVAEFFGSSAAEGDDGAALAEEGGEGSGLEVAEVGLAVLGEDIGDGELVAGFDLAVEVEEAPAEAVGEEGAGGGFAGAHEAGEDDAV